MPVHLEREIETLKKDILAVGAMAEASVRQATLSIENRDEHVAQEVIDKDIRLDEMEVEVEEKCLKILALHQPVATDLRFIVAVLKINNDLERVGDLAVNIAERALFLASRPETSVTFDLTAMAAKAQSMLKNSLDALVTFSPDLAREVCGCDDEVDAMNRQMYQIVQHAAAEQSDEIESLIHLLSASRHLERIADHATNIAEDVIYMIEGQIVRHRSEEYREQSRNS